MAPQGESLHIGVNKVDPAHYNGWEGTLRACEFDAEDMRALAVGKGFTASILLTQEATAAAVTAGIAAAADRLAESDIFFLSYSGHGGQVPDLNSDDDADDKDETWVLYDRQLVDDELYALFARFKPGVRIFMLSDSCHSGSVAKDIFDAAVPTSSRRRWSTRQTADEGSAARGSGRHVPRERGRVRPDPEREHERGAAGARREPAVALRLPGQPTLARR